MWGASQSFYMYNSKNMEGLYKRYPGSILYKIFFKSLVECCKEISISVNKSGMNTWSGEYKASTKNFTGNGSLFVSCGKADRTLNSCFCCYCCCCRGTTLRTWPQRSSKINSFFALGQVDFYLPSSSLTHIYLWGGIHQEWSVSVNHRPDFFLGWDPSLQFKVFLWFGIPYYKTGVLLAWDLSLNGWLYCKISLLFFLRFCQCCKSLNKICSCSFLNWFIFV